MQYGLLDALVAAAYLLGKVAAEAGFAWFHQQVVELVGGVGWRSGGGGG